MKFPLFLATAFIFGYMYGASAHPWDEPQWGAHNTDMSYPGGFQDTCHGTRVMVNGVDGSTIISSNCKSCSGSFTQTSITIPQTQWGLPVENCNGRLVVTQRCPPCPGGF